MKRATLVLTCTRTLRCVCNEGFENNANNSLVCDDVDECKTVSRYLYLSFATLHVKNTVYRPVLHSGKFSLERQIFSLSCELPCTNNGSRQKSVNGDNQCQSKKYKIEKIKSGSLSLHGNWNLLAGRLNRGWEYNKITLNRIPADRRIVLFT